MATHLPSHRAALGTCVRPCTRGWARPGCCRAGRGRPGEVPLGGRRRAGAATRRQSWGPPAPVPRSRSRGGRPCWLVVVDCGRESHGSRSNVTSKLPQTHARISYTHYHSPVQDGHALAPQLLQRIRRGGQGVVENAEAARPVPRGVVARRARQREGRAAGGTAAAGAAIVAGAAPVPEQGVPRRVHPGGASEEAGVVGGVVGVCGEWW